MPNFQELISQALVSRPETTTNANKVLGIMEKFLNNNLNNTTNQNLIYSIPNYQFFLLIGLSAIGTLILFCFCCCCIIKCSSLMNCVTPYLVKIGCKFAERLKPKNSK